MSIPESETHPSEEYAVFLTGSPCGGTKPGRMIFVFAGQGSQWRGMGRDLMCFPEIREAVMCCDRLMGPYLGWSVLEEMERDPDDSRLEDSLIAQPAIFSLQMGLIAFLEKRGIRPEAVIGHSVGEVAAARAAGVLSLEDAARVICMQNRVMQKVVGRGRMLFAALSPEELAPFLAPHGDLISLAAHNSPRATVLSGGEALDQIAHQLKAAGVFHKMLRIDIAFHGPQIEPYVETLAQSLEGITAHPAEIPVYSTPRGGLALSGDFDGRYWARHMRCQTRFAEAMARAAEDGAGLCLEIGPHPVLAQSLEECFHHAGRNYAVLPTLRRDQPQLWELAAVLTRLRNLGIEPDLEGTTPEEKARIACLDRLSRKTSSIPAIPEDIAAASPEIQKKWLFDLVRGTAAEIVGDPSFKPDPGLGLMQLGFDSVMVVRMMTLLSSRLDMSLPSTLVFDYPNMGALAGYLGGKVFGINEDLAFEKKKPARSVPRQPVAVVGMGCRFPGGAHDPERFWAILDKKTDAVCVMPPDRWPVDDFYDPDPDVPGKMTTREGGFLQKDIAEFDAGFFNIAPKEALALDPQQRLLLEVAWEALENAGLTDPDYRGKNVGVYLGISTDDYKKAHLWSEDLGRIDAYSALGGMFSSAGGRLSYQLGLHGPNISVDTACSSSLVALYLACRALRSGEIDTALVAGVNIMASPNLFVYFSKLRALAPDGRCKTFDASANGYGRGEGCGVLILKRLEDARADKDPIQALIHGAAVNQDGASSGFTAPNGLAQQDVIRRALADAGFRARDVSYVEAHGTGTPLGDPIEVGALGETYGKGRDAAEPLTIGSVKANIGHLEAAAGMAGLFKIILAMRAQKIPGQPHFQSPNPGIGWDRLPIRVSRDGSPWPRNATPRLAGLSSFGFSGTNAHVIVGEPPVDPVENTESHAGIPMLVTLSSKTENGLDDTIRAFSGFVAERTDLDLSDLAFTTQCGRNHFEYRAAFAVSESNRLQALTERVPRAGKLPEGTGVAFLYTGQGAQYAGMGRDLYQTEPRFRVVIDECDRVLTEHMDGSLIEKLFGDGL